MVTNKRSTVLFQIGEDDAWIYKGKLKGDLQQRWNATYNYGDEQGAVLGVLGRGCFTPRRIQVIQMISP